ncbi:MAG: flagellar filament capping protein FliD [Bradymonadia bacterium]
MSISISGLASGLDVDGIINQLLTLERAPITSLQQKIVDAEQRNASYSDLSGRLGSLRSAARDLNSSSLFGSKTATSSDSSLVTVNATDKASNGTYTVKALQKATTNRLGAQGFVDDNATAVAAAAGTFSFQIGDGSEIEIDVNESTTLSQLADAINDASSDVRAEIVNDGTATNPFRLILSGVKGGTDNEVKVVQNDTTLDFANKQIEAATADTTNNAAYLGAATASGTYTGTGNANFVVEIIQDGTAAGGAGAARYRFSTDGGLTFDDNGGSGFEVTSGGPIALADGVEINFTDNGSLTTGDTFRIDAVDPVLQEAKDAMVEINGITITNGSNSFTDVFEGMTFSIADVDPSKTVTLSIDDQIGDVEGSLTSFIGAYNSVVGFINGQFDYDPASGLAAPALNGDSAVRNVQRRLKALTLGRVPGLNGSTISALSELGIESNSETGLLSLNSGTLSSALNSDSKAVERLLTGVGEVITGDFTFRSRNSRTQPGEYTVEVETARTRASFTAGADAQVIGADETLSFNFQDGIRTFDVNLLAGDDVDTQVGRLNQAFSDNNVGMAAFVSDGRINIRTTLYGSEQTFTVISDQAAGANSGIGNVESEATGTDLSGRIGGIQAEVIDGNVFRGARGFGSEGMLIEIPDDSQTGILGRVRVSDGLGETLPDLIDSLTDDVIGSRTDGIRSQVTRLEEQIDVQNERVSRVEERLRRQFVGLEVQLAELQALGDYVSQQLSALSSLSGGG